MAKRQLYIPRSYLLYSLCKRLYLLAMVIIAVYSTGIEVPESLYLYTEMQVIGQETNASQGRCNMKVVNTLGLTIFLEMTISFHADGSYHTTLSATS